MSADSKAMAVYIRSLQIGKLRERVAMLRTIEHMRQNLEKASMPIDARLRGLDILRNQMEKV